jgi:UDP-glucose 4-epimerase
MKKCLITGVTGLIGEQVVTLLDKKWEIYALVRKPTDLSPDIQYIRCDLADEWSIEGFPKAVDAVIHLAQSEYFREFPIRGEHIFRVNVASTIRLLEYARKCKAQTFILASSGGIYGHGDEGLKEDRPVETKGDLGFYLGTKLCAELMSENYSSFMNILILRFFFVYGPGQRTTMLIPRLVKAVKEERPIILHGREGLKINPIYVTDAASAVYRSLELPGSQKINIAGQEILSLKQIGQEIGEVLNREPIFELKENIKPQHLVGDIRKMTHVLGPPVVRFREGIAKYIEGQNDR